MKTHRLIVEVCGDPIVGLWCDRCMLPSAVAMVLRLGRSTMKVHSWCEECDV